MARIAFIGLGNMGSGMAANLAKAGHDVRAFDLSAKRLARDPKANDLASKFMTDPHFAALRQMPEVQKMLPRK